jgi:hypothetical protein
MLHDVPFGNAPFLVVFISKGTFRRPWQAFNRICDTKFLLILLHTKVLRIEFLIDFRSMKSRQVL